MRAEDYGNRLEKMGIKMRDKVWKIAVCDDETVFLEKIQQLAAQYYSERNIQA